MIVKERDFQKGLVFWLVTVIATLLFSECFISCKSKKPLVETVTTVLESKELVSVRNELVKSKAINDSLFAFIGNIRTSKPECDSVCQEAVDKALQNVNSKKTSGGNQAGFYYDKYKKMLVAYSKLEETVSQTKDSTNIQYKFLSVNIYKPVLIPAEFTKEQKFHLWLGRLCWVVLAVLIIYKLRKRIPA